MQTKHVYEIPLCAVMEAAAEQFICTSPSATIEPLTRDDEPYNWN